MSRLDGPLHAKAASLPLSLSLPLNPCFLYLIKEMQFPRRERPTRRSSLGTSGEEMSLVYFLIAIIHFYAKSSQSRWRSHNLFSYSGDGRAGK
jgi:hypothetical protein